MMIIIVGTLTAAVLVVGGNTGKISVVLAQGEKKYNTSKENVTSFTAF